MDAGQFESRKELSLSAASIKSAQSRASIPSTVKNSKGIVVGRWIGDGVKWNTEDKAIATAINACVSVAAPRQGDDEIPFKYFDLVAASSNFSDFTPRGLNVPLTDVGLLCVDLQPGSPPMFPAASVTYEDITVTHNFSLIEGWESATFTSTWTSAEYSCLIFAIVAYAIAFVVSAGVLGW